MRREGRGARARPPARQSRVTGSAVLALAGLAALLAGAAAVLMYATRGLTFFNDEWGWLLYRRANGLDAFLAPSNEHLTLVPIAVYKLLLVTAGLESYLPYRLALVASVVLLGILVWEYARRRVGPLAALAPTAVLVLLGPSWENLLWPAGIGFIGATAAGIGALLALERRDVAGDAAAVLLLALALASSSLGLAFLAAALVELAVPRERRRALWVAGAPALLYGAWYLAYGRGAGELRLGNVLETPAYVATSAAAAVGAFAGLDLDWGRPLLVALVAGAALLARRRYGGLAAVPLRLWSVLAATLVFWGLAGVFRAHVGAAVASRYLLPGGVLVALALLELARGVRPGGRGLAALALATGIVVASNLGELAEGRGFLLARTQAVAAELGALELARARVAPGFQPDPARAPQISAGPYLAAVDAHGSPADSPAEIAARPAYARAAADRVLVRALGVVVEPRRASREECRRGQRLELRVPAGGVALRAEDAPVGVALRRFGPRFVALPPLKPRAEGVLRLPADAAPQPWVVGVSSPDAAIACLLP